MAEPTMLATILLLPWLAAIVVPMTGRSGVGRILAMVAMLTVVWFATALFVGIRWRDRADPVRCRRAVDAVARHQPEIRGGRLQRLLPAAHRAAVSGGAGLRLADRRGPQPAVPRPAARAPGGPARHLPGAGPARVLRAVGSGPDPDGAADPGVRRRAAATGGDDVLPLHDGRQRAVARGRDLARGGKRKADGRVVFRLRDVAGPAPDDEPATVRVRRRGRGLRGQEPAVPVPRLAAAGLRRGLADRHGADGGRAVQDGRLRLHPVRGAVLPRRRPARRPDHDGARRRSASCTAPCSRCASGITRCWSRTHR